ncbi:MAG: Holliday junction DNA helicase RuvA [Myxococcota bacterium]|jgi:Holliday junction DNA helicase RuvA
MIAWLKGALRARKDDGGLIIDVNGVGYAVQVPVGVLGQDALGAEVELHIYTQVREDQLALYGFEDTTQLAAFNALIGVSKVGPKLALNVLSGIAPRELAIAVDSQDIARLTTVSGVGKRLAERLTVELRGKLDVSALGGALAAGHAAGSPVFRDLRSALENLQYRPKEVEQVLDVLRAEAPEAPFDDLLRRALQHLRK